MFHLHDFYNENELEKTTSFCYYFPMRYENIKKGIFISRPNRFIAHVELNGREEAVHVKNTGRCRELLVPGATVWLEKSQDPSRKTGYDLVSVEKGRRFINMDSQAPNKLFREWAMAGEFLADLTYLKAEHKWGNSRFDFYAEAGERKLLIEVKGVTLERNGVALFPDAPTERGVKHINELVFAHAEGYETYIIFVIQMEDVFYFIPNDETHPQFGEALRNAAASGVNILALNCVTKPGEAWIKDKIPVKI